MNTFPPFLFHAPAIPSAPYFAQPLDLLQPIANAGLASSVLQVPNSPFSFQLQINMHPPFHGLLDEEAQNSLKLPNLIGTSLIPREKLKLGQGAEQIFWSAEFIRLSNAMPQSLEGAPLCTCTQIESRQNDISGNEHTAQRGRNVETRTEPRHRRSGVLTLDPRRLRFLFQSIRKKPDHQVLIHAANKHFRRNLVGVHDHRGSEYIGVTKNAHRWQTQIMVGSRKRYVGTYNNAEEAARDFDKHAFLLRGLKVRHDVQAGKQLIGSYEL